MNNILNNFIKEYNKNFTQEKIKSNNTLINNLNKIKLELLNEKFHSSMELKNNLDKLIVKANNPLEVAITGQFSSGKSTFLNSLLSKSILPTGITPVTSKVNFIKYGKEYKLKITYYNGKDEYTSLEEIKSFTDQRLDELKDVKFLTLYAPLDILKNITFVDTPGLNSQSQNDTNVTTDILKEVGGIIWLSLIDNAGKLSEAQILDEYLKNFKDKSLCVLNQKDKFTEEQINTTVDYVSNKFNKYFTKVIPISAKLALESRTNNKNILISNEQEKIIKAFEEKILTLNTGTLSLIEKDFTNFKNNINKLENKNFNNNLKLLEESNINEVLDFIDKHISPQAKEAKKFAIKTELLLICDTLIKEYNTILSTYDALKETLETMEAKILEKYNSLYNSYNKQLFIVFSSLEDILEKITLEIYKNIQNKNSYRFQTDKTKFLKNEKINKYEYQTFWINSDNIYKNLFYDDQTCEKLFKKSLKQLDNIAILVDNNLIKIFNDLKNEIYKWQEPYELIRKQNNIGSDIEFANTRIFAAKIYENILKDFEKITLNSTSSLREKFSYFNGALSYSFIQITQATVAHLENFIHESEELYCKEPTKFSIQRPTQEEIFNKLKINFSFEKVEDFLVSNRNYLKKTVANLKEKYKNTNIDKINFIDEKKEVYVKKIIDIENIKTTIDKII